MQPKPIDRQAMALRALVRQVFNQSKHSAGARTIAHIITNQHDIKLSRYQASNLMSELGLVSKQMKHRYKQREDKHNIYDNVLNRKFSPTAPNQVWTGDVTYIRIKGGWCYLAVVIDLYSRNVVGFTVSDSPDSKLTSKALRMAYEARLKPSGLLFHSDQGSHYTSKEFAVSLASCKGMKHSMSRKGNCWDNAPTERFFRSFKTEWMPKYGYASQASATQDVMDYIWGYYRNIRPHQYNNYLTPFEKERLYFNHNLLNSVQ